MGFKYFEGKNWIDISREERLYCAHLYFQIIGKELEFVKWLNNNKQMELPTNVEWEVGYEVCLYRDALKNRNESIKKTEYPQKRTFDLCLFSESNILIIEAKVQTGFESEQIDDFRNDASLIHNLCESNVKVDTILLASSIYFENHSKFGKKEIIDQFNFRISWMELYQRYYEKIFLQADKLYNN